MKTYDQRIIDSAGAFLVGELERLDKTLHMPLFSTSWGRDIDLRTDVSIADEVSSYTLSNFAAPGGINPAGKNWIAGNATEIPGIALDIHKKTTPLRLWGMALSWTIIELAKSEQVGRPLDAQKYEGMKIKHGMDVDEMVYVGDAETGATGLLNSAQVAPANAADEWADADPEDILSGINDIINAGWEKTGYAICPHRLLLPPRQFSMLTRPVTTAGSKSILTYVSEECVANSLNGRPLEIFPVKWLAGRGADGADRAVAYTKDELFVRFPMVPLRHTPVEYRGLAQITTYFGALGEVEFVYPETIVYMDGI
jgi:hypothetical protein